MRRGSWLVSLLLLAGCESDGLLPPSGSVVGTWGARDAGFIVSDTSAHAHIGCTYGDIHQPIVVDAQGRFDISGQYNINAYPVDLGILHPARFIGVVDGAELTLTVVLTDTTASFGPVTLTYGKDPTMAVCPICRPGEQMRRRARLP
jgi:hypothetical protein